MDNDKEGRKENIPPRKKPRKIATTPIGTGLKAQLFSCDAKKREMEKLEKTKSTPATPLNGYGRDGQDPAGSPTPRRLDIALGQSVLRSSPRLIENGRKEMRRMLRDEADGAEAEEDDDAF
jgi:hypothetical protein